MSKFNHYELYRASEYFNTEIPSHWEEKQLGFLAKQDRNAFVDGPFGSDLKTTDYQDDGIPLIQLNNIRDGKHLLKNIKFVTKRKSIELSRHIAYPKDIVFAKMAEPVARAAKVNEAYPDYVIVADCVKMTPNKKIINEDYLVWAVNSDCVRMNAELVSTGTTRIRISLGELKKIRIPFPSLVEQSKIALFLNHETTKINKLIDKQQQLIELLKEKRQAVISHAVTKGLNPDVPMKDSGVEWLGEVPKHWVVTRAKFISNIFVPQRNKPELNDDAGLFWVTMENMSQQYITYSSQFVSDAAALKSGSKILPQGAVIASCVGSFGISAINMVDVIINQQLQAFQPVNIKAEFLMALITISRNYFELICTAATLTYVNKEGFENLPVVVPPKNEQISICKFINDSNEKFEMLMEHSLDQVNLLKERRAALISAAVTGKIDVRDWVAPEKQDVEEPQETTA
ncbi:type I restriction enzyme S subunit [Pantoea sp. AG1095]|uniref:restriction endonuclease subunit S n=1 Tax=Pantoea sp. AG1095 TaxID=2184004 RepID=UPI000D9E13B9|nr:restriction endonuclease subunit S [Pantoea sp. AG1095]PYG50989.1 type I restriction enzyme S subunit [Pantoea sp. AG1095]